MYSKIKQFLDAAPTALKSANEIYNFARNKYKQVMGVFPDGLDDVFLKRGAAEMQDIRQKVVQFPGGGKDKVNPFILRPEKKSLDLAKELEELTNKNLEERGLGSIKLGDELPPPKNKKPDVDPTLQAMEDQIEMFKDFSNRIKGMSSTDRVAERLRDLKNVELSELSGIEAQKIASEVIGRKGPFKTISSKGAKEVLGELEPIIKRADAEVDLGTKLKNFDGDPDAMAMGGRIEMSKGGGIINFIKSLLKKKEKSPSESFQDYLKKMREESDRMNKEFYEGLKPGGELDQNITKIKEGYKFPDRDQIKKQIKERMDKKKLEKFDVEGRKPNAMGGRIEMSKGGGLIDLLKFFSKKSPFQAYKDYLASVKKRSIEGDFKSLAPELGAVSAGGILANRKMKSILEEGNELQKERFLKEYIEEINNNPKYKDRPELRDKMIENYTESLFGEKRAMGGRIGFDEGGPSNKNRRNFLKLMGGLASIPIVGKLLKPAAKVAEAGPRIAEGVKLGFDKFVMLVNKIKNLGQKTDKVTQKEREVGYTYEGKDGSQYELVEDLVTGDIRVTKDKPGFAMSGDETFDTIEDRSTFYVKKGRADETTKGKTPPDEYDEVKEVPSRDGTFDDIDEVDDSTVKEILEELGETKTKTKKSGGGLAYMLGE